MTDKKNEFVQFLLSKSFNKHISTTNISKNHIISVNPFKEKSQYHIGINDVEVICPIKINDLQKSFMEEIIFGLEYENNIFFDIPPVNQKNLLLLNATVAYLKNIKDKIIQEENNLNYKIPKIVFVTKSFEEIEDLINEIKKLAYEVKMSVFINGKLVDYSIKFQALKLFECPFRSQYLNKDNSDNKFKLNDNTKDDNLENLISSVKKMRIKENRFEYNEDNIDNFDIIFIDYKSLFSPYLDYDVINVIKNSFLILNDIDGYFDYIPRVYTRYINTKILEDLLENLNDYLNKFNNINDINLEYENTINEEVVKRQIKLIKNIILKIKEYLIFGGLEALDFSDFINIFKFNKITIEKSNIILKEKYSKKEIIPFYYDIEFNITDLDIEIEILEKLKHCFQKNNITLKNLIYTIYFFDLFNFILNEGYEDYFEFVIYDYNYLNNINKDNNSKKTEDNIKFDETDGRGLSILNIDSGVALKRIMYETDNGVLVCSELLNPFNLYTNDIQINFLLELVGEPGYKDNQCFFGAVSCFSDNTENEFDFSVKNENENRNKSLYDLLNVLSVIVPGGILVFFNYMENLKSFYSYYNNNKHSFKKKVVFDLFNLSYNKKSFYNYRKANINGNDGAILIMLYSYKDCEKFYFTDNDKRMIILVGIKYPDNCKEVTRLKNYYYNTDDNDWNKEKAFNLINIYINNIVKHEKDYGAVLLLDKNFCLNGNLNYISQSFHDKIKIYNSLNYKSLDSDLKSFYKDLGVYYPNKTIKDNKIENDDNNKENIGINLPVNYLGNKYLLLLEKNKMKKLLTNNK